jgi:prevent-host-death family protein
MVSIAEAKARLSELVETAAGGTPVEITRRGKPIARIVPIVPARRPIVAAELKALTDQMPLQKEDSGTFMRRIRDEERY